MVLNKYKHRLHKVPYTHIQHNTDKIHLEVD